MRIISLFLLLSFLLSTRAEAVSDPRVDTKERFLKNQQEFRTDYVELLEKKADAKKNIWETATSPRKQVEFRVHCRVETPSSFEIKKISFIVDQHKIRNFFPSPLSSLKWYSVLFSEIPVGLLNLVVRAQVVLGSAFEPFSGKQKIYEGENFFPLSITDQPEPLKLLLELSAPAWNENHIKLKIQDLKL